MIAKHLVVLFIAAVLMVARPAQAQIEGRVAIALVTLDAVMSTVAQTIMAGMGCDAGDAKSWYLVISTVDRRYHHCVKEDSGWSGMLRGWDREIAIGKAEQLKDPGIGSYAYFRYVNEFESSVPKNGGLEAFCASAPWKILIDPWKNDPQVRANFLRVHPNTDIDALQKAFRLVRNLGLERAWAEKPCDDFWPFTMTLPQK